MRREARAVDAHAVALGAGIAGADGLDRLLARQRPDLLIFAGICGALDPSLRAGDLILARAVMRSGSQALRPDPRCLEAARVALRSGLPTGGSGPTFISSGLLTVTDPVVRSEARRDLWNEYGAAGVDMETYGLASAAQDRGLPWLAIRAVSDKARTRLPAALANWRGEDDDARIALALLRRPWELPSAALLVRNTGRAMQTLHVAVRTLVRLTAADWARINPQAPEHVAG
jgi:adenosylhomocysteine nucleosidase